jgi:hypothetical protein
MSNSQIAETSATGNTSERQVTAIKGPVHHWIELWYGVDRFVGSEVQHQVFVFGPMWLARGLGLYSRVSNLEVMKLQF